MLVPRCRFTTERWTTLPERASRAHWKTLPIQSLCVRYYFANAVVLSVTTRLNQLTASSTGLLFLWSRQSSFELGQRARIYDIIIAVLLEVGQQLRTVREMSGEKARKNVYCQLYVCRTVGHWRQYWRVRGAGPQYFVDGGPHVIGPPK